jgi:hypothetical protein
VWVTAGKWLCGLTVLLIATEFGYCVMAGTWLCGLTVLIATEFGYCVTAGTWLCGLTVLIATEFAYHLTVHLLPTNMLSHQHATLNKNTALQLKFVICMSRVNVYRLCNVTANWFTQTHTNKSNQSTQQNNSLITSHCMTQ